MTLPASSAGRKPEPAQPPLDFPSPPRSDPTSRLRAAMQANLSANAFKLIAAVVVNCPENEWLSNDAMAAAAGFTSHQARPLTAELVSAGLLRARRARAIVNGVKRDVRRYLPVVPE